jgi:hypothetical protein
MIPLEQKIARLQAPSPAAMLPNPRISSDLHYYKTGDFGRKFETE